VNGYIKGQDYVIPNCLCPPPQYGSADNKVTYTHRIGRTGRAGRSGEGILVLLPFERKLLGGLRQSGVEENNKLVDKSLDEAREMLQPVRNRIQSGNIKLMSSAEGAYRAFLAYYMSRADRLGVYSAEHIVQSANDFAASVGLSKLPSLSEKTAKKLNLKGVNGVSIDNDIELM
jgi:ATP-dependent RNA helicase MSS116